MEFDKEFANKFTEQARRVLEVAQEEALHQQKTQIETEHILIALIHEGGGVATKVFTNLGVHLQQLQETIVALQAQTPEANPPQPQMTEETSPSTRLDFTPEAKQVLQFAIDEVRLLNHRSVGTEHLLLGILRQPESLASKALQAHNVQLENARTVVIRLFIHPPGLQNIKAQLRSQLARDQGAPTRARFDKFTERARKVLSLAQEEAQRFQHNYIGTEHLLLGLVREREGVAANALNNLDISLEKVRNAVEFIIGRGDRVVLGEVGLTPRAKKVIELAVDEARRLNHPYIGTEHILLGLVREGEGIAAGVLQSLGVKLDVLRTAILSILQQEETPDTSENLAPDETIHVLNAANVVHHVTKQALQTIQFADSERARLNYPTMCTEHLLLGLLHDEQSVTALVFKESGIELATIYPAIEALQEREEQAYPWSSEFTPLVRAMQDIAGHEALRLNSPLIGNEHLLLAILRFPESNAVKILQQLGADSTTLRSKLVERLQQS